LTIFNLLKLDFWLCEISYINGSFELLADFASFIILKTIWEES